jgi:thiamine biosynthesis protein ThiS
MRITVNGKPETVDDGASLLDFIHMKNLEPGKVVIELNLEIVDRKNLGDVLLRENDSPEVVK